MLERVSGVLPRTSAVSVIIDHLTVVCSVTKPLNDSEAGGLVLIQTSLVLFCESSLPDANRLHLHEKGREVCISARPPPASLPFKGQATEQTIVKWPILRLTVLYA